MHSPRRRVATRRPLSEGLEPRVLFASNVVHFGSLKSFAGPGDPTLDLSGTFLYAVNLGSEPGESRTVNGVRFTDDRTTPRVTVPAGRIGNGAVKSHYGSGVAPASGNLYHHVRLELTVAFTSPSSFGVEDHDVLRWTVTHTA